MNGFHRRHGGAYRAGGASPASPPSSPRVADTGAPGALSRPHSLAAAPLLALALLAAPLPKALLAGEADVLGGVVTPLGEGTYRIDATVRHEDRGWDHYANRWDVLAPDGTLLGSRELLHPHDDEQPFTRSLTLDLPAGITHVTLRAADSVHGTGGASVELEVPR